MMPLCASRDVEPAQKEDKKGQRKKKSTKKLCLFLVLPLALSRLVQRLLRCEHILFTSGTETEMLRRAHD